MSSMMDKIYAGLLLEMHNLEEFDKQKDNGTSADKTKLQTQEVVIRFTLDSVDHYLVLDERDIRNLMTEKAAGLRRELHKAGLTGKTP